jgi:hypothetical protein
MSPLSMTSKLVGLLGRPVRVVVGNAWEIGVLRRTPERPWTYRIHELEFEPESVTTVDELSVDYFEGSLELLLSLGRENPHFEFEYEALVEHFVGILGLSVHEARRQIRLRISH